MSKQKGEIVCGTVEESPYNTENLQEYFDYAGKDEDGKILVRRKPDNTPAVEKAVNISVAVIFKLFGL